jgi:hypothetical protein
MRLQQTEEAKKIATSTLNRSPSNKNIGEDSKVLLGSPIIKNIDDESLAPDKSCLKQSSNTSIKIGNLNFPSNTSLLKKNSNSKLPDIEN